MTLAEILATFRPEPSCGCRTWADHAAHLWRIHPFYMSNLVLHMADVGWFGGSATHHDGYIQDAHHRLCALMALGRFDFELPVEEIVKVAG
jgi:hypothetical protein